MSIVLTLLLLVVIAQLWNLNSLVRQTLEELRNAGKARPSP